MMWSKHIQTFYFLNDSGDRYVKAHFIKVGTSYKRVSKLFSKLGEGDLVIFERGFYGFKGSQSKGHLTIETNHVTIYGNHATLDATVELLNTENVTLLDLEFTSSGDTVNRGIEAIKSKYTKIKGISLKGSLDIILRDSSDCQIVECNIKSGNISIYTSRNSIVRDNRVLKERARSGALIGVQSSTNIIVSNNYLELRLAGNHSAIGLGDSDGIVVKNNFIFDSIITFSGITRSIVYGNVCVGLTATSPLINIHYSRLPNRYNSITSNVVVGGRIEIAKNPTVVGQLIKHNMLVSNQSELGINDLGDYTKMYNNLGGIASAN